LCCPEKVPFPDKNCPQLEQWLASPKNASEYSVMKIGYARVSTDEQNLSLQLDALRAAGCETVFQDQGVSGAARVRPGLDQALAALKAGDVLVVWKLDRLGRSLVHLIAVITDLGGRGVGFRSLSESIDTETAGGRLVFHMMGALAEFERALIAERTRAGIKATKARGGRIGRRKALTPAQLEHAALLVEQGESVVQVARSLKVGRSTLYEALSNRAHKLSIEANDNRQ
jgi:DNA invertase Pin-like site-specific DNA recombinase